MSDIKWIVVNELHKPARKNFRRRRVIINGFNDLYQADLVEMLPYSKHNSNFKYVLIVIDTFSKYIWALPVNNKSAKEIVIAMKKILKKPNIPKNLQTDLGKEFYNSEFSKLMKNLGINHYSTFSNVKASIIERSNRTLKNIDVERIFLSRFI